MDYLGLLGSEDRARRFSEEVIDRKLNFFAVYTKDTCFSSI